MEEEEEERERMKYLIHMQPSVRAQPTRIQGNFFNPSKGIYIEPEFTFNGKILSVSPPPKEQKGMNFSIDVHSVEILENENDKERNTGKNTERADMALSSQEG